MGSADPLWNGQPTSYWVEMLRHPDGEIRWQAIDAIRHISPPIDSIPLFICALRDNDWRTRALAAHALYDLAFDEELHCLLQQAVIPLVDALEDDSPHVRINSAHTLELLGPEATVAVPALNRIIEHGDEELRQAATDAIVAISQRE